MRKRMSRMKKEMAVAVAAAMAMALTVSTGVYFSCWLRRWFFQKSSS